MTPSIFLEEIGVIPPFGRKRSCLLTKNAFLSSCPSFTFLDDFNKGSKNTKKNDVSTYLLNHSNMPLIFYIFQQIFSKIVDDTYGNNIKIFCAILLEKKLEMNTVRSNIVKVKLYSGKK